MSAGLPEQLARQDAEQIVIEMVNFRVDLSRQAGRLGDFNALAKFPIPSRFCKTECTVVGTGSVISNFHVLLLSFHHVDCNPSGYFGNSRN
jgi:hypothetical protein